MKSRGFTLVEILIGASVLMLVLGGLYSLFTGVGRSHKSLSVHTHLQKMAYTMFKTFREDVRNASSMKNAVEHVIEFEMLDKNGDPVTVMWEFFTGSKTIRRTLDGKKRDFSSKGYIKKCQFVTYDDSGKGSVGSGNGTISDPDFKKACAGRLVIDFSVLFTLKKDRYLAGFFKREFSRVALKGASD